MKRNSIIMLLSGVAFAYANIYPLIRLHFDGAWGSSGTGLMASYGYPLQVGISSGCFTGPSFFYGNLAMNTALWAAVTSLFWTWPMAWSQFRGIFGALRKGLEKALALP